MGYAAMAAQAAGNVLNAFGSLVSGHAAAASDKYNSEVSNENARIAKENEGIASQAGMQQEGMQELKTRGEFGATKANEAGSGVDVNSGSTVDTQASIKELGELDALTVRSNATKEAYGYSQQERSFKEQSTLDKYQEGADLESSYINAGSSLLNGGSQATTSYQKYQMNGGFSF